MIYGIGTDICDVRRIRASLERHGERFAERVLGAARDRGLPRPPRARRGARPALPRDPLLRQGSVQKAIGLGMRMPMTWRALRDRQGGRAASPRSCCTARSPDWFEARGLAAHVSVTDETDYAASFVVVEAAKSNSA